MRARTSRRVVRMVVCLAALLAAAPFGPGSLRAQWLHYPTAGVPRTPAGAPDLERARAANG